MFANVKKNDYPFLAYRTLANSLNQIILTFSSQYIPIIIIGVVNNLAPIITVLLAYVFLNERLKIFELVFLILLVGGVYTIVLGAN